jgi:hypothetical protein
MTARKVEEDCLKLAHQLRNAFLAIFLSLTLTLIFGVLYVSYPFILEILSAYFRNPGIGGVAGGVSGSFLKILLILASTLFLIFFALLQRMRAKS